MKNPMKGLFLPDLGGAKYRRDFLRVGSIFSKHILSVLVQGDPA